MREKRTSQSDRPVPTQADNDTRPRRRGARLWLLVSIYMGLALAPLGLAFFHIPIGSRSIFDEIASALAIIAFAALLVEFLFTGRHRWISGRIGIDRTIRIHRLVAYAIVAFIFIHPFLYTAPDGVSWPWFNASDPTLAINGWSLTTGLAAWILTATLVLTAIERNRLPWTYETWRIVHAGGAIVLGALIAVHAISAGGYSSKLPLAIYWLVLLVAAMVTLIELFLYRPWHQRQTPYLVHTIDKVGDRTWSVKLRPERPGPANTAMNFRPGQFAWLKLGRGAFATRDHPFSMSSASTDDSTIGFTIKEKGDFTDRIGNLTAGTRVYLDGPHGHLIPDDEPVPTVYIAGGTGISPVLSHLRTFMAENDDRALTLIYSIATNDAIPHREELARMAQTFDLTVHYIVQHPTWWWRGAIGSLDHELLNACLPENDRAGHRYFICGPPRLVKSAYTILRGLGIPGSRIVTGS